MTKLHETTADDAGAALPTGITTTYRVVSSGDEMRSPSHSESRMPRPSALRQWLRRQHPADVVRVVLLLIAVGAVMLAVARIG